MELSSPRFKSIAVTLGFSLWFFIITSAIGLFSVEYFIIFIITSLALTQIFASKLSRVLDVFAIYNTRIFLGIIFIFVVSIYGVLFKILGIDLIRLKKQNNSYWLEPDKENDTRILKQY